MAVTTAAGSDVPGIFSASDAAGGSVAGSKLMMDVIETEKNSRRTVTYLSAVQQYTTTCSAALGMRA